MQLETVLVYNESLIHQAVFEFWRRTTGALYVPILLLATACFVALFVLNHLSWQTGAIGMLIGVGFVMAATVYVVHYRNSMAKFRAMREPTATFQADENAFTVESDIGKSTLKWASVEEVWIFQDVWLLLFSKAQFSTLPVANLTPQFQQLIISSVKSAGGKIR